MEEAVHAGGVAMQALVIGCWRVLLGLAFCSRTLDGDLLTGLVSLWVGRVRPSGASLSP